jgi:two-component system, OmpR family, response regulator VicR
MWWREIVKKMFIIVVGEKMVKKIMIVDDNPDIILSIKNGLEDSAEYKVIGAESGEKCLEILEDEMPDLILLDIMMPEMSGWETYDTIKENEAWREIPLVFLTARTDKIARDAGDFLGEDYIEKPFEIDDIMERIDKILGR